MAHSLVPPTPGPITVVENLNQTLEATGQQELDLGIMIAGGLLLGVITILVGYLYALWANRVFRIPMRRTAMSELTEFEPDPERRLPPLSAAILPVVIPFLLIMIGTIVTSLWGKSTDTDYPLAGQIVLMLGDKHAALAVGALVAVVLALRYRPAGMELPKVIQSALAGGGVIILITAAGAAFGQIMKETGIAEELKDWFSGPEAGGKILIVAFVLTALVRMAQGSATVSMVTTGAIMASLLQGVELDFHPLYLALAIGCGSKPGPWMNDSGFWVISKMSGMTEGETLKTFSVMLTLMGTVGFLVVWIASRIMPMA